MTSGINKMKPFRRTPFADAQVALRATSKATMYPEINRYENYVPVPKTDKVHLPSRIRGTAGGRSWLRVFPMITNGINKIQLFLRGTLRSIPGQPPGYEQSHDVS
jgi:hypothetical protein